MTDLALPWLPKAMQLFDRIVIDGLAQEATMSKPMIRPELIAGDLMGLVIWDVAGRQNKSERTTFAFCGLAVGDLALTGLAYAAPKRLAC